MATDLANLSIAVDTKDLEKGVVALNKFSTSSKSVYSDVSKLGTQMSGASKVFANAILGMNKGILSLVNATQNATIEQREAAAQNVRYSAAVVKSSKSVYDFSAAQKKLKNDITQTNTALGKQSVLANKNFMSSSKRSKGEIDIGGVTRDTTANRFNTANIAAQFQDVGVTAAMGMNPLTIALQQGTQLSAVLNTMENPLQGIAYAFKSIINPVSLLSIGLVALTAHFIQITDWTKVWEKASNTLVSVLDFMIDNVEILTIGVSALSVAMVANSFLSFATAMSAANLGIIGLIKSTVVLTVATAAQTFSNIALGKSSLAVNAAVVKQTAAMGALTKTTAVATLAGKVLGATFGTAWAIISSPITLIVAGLALVAGAAVGIGNAIMGVETTMESFMYGVKWFGNGVIATFVGVVKVIYESFKWLFDNISTLAKLFANTLSDILTKPLQIFLNGIKSVAKQTNDLFDLNINLDGIDGVADKLQKPFKEVGETTPYVEKMGDVLKETFETDYIGDLSNSFSKGLTSIKDNIKSTTSVVEDETDKWLKIQEDFNQRMNSLRLETSLIGANTYQTTYENEKYRLTNELMQAGVKDTSAYTEAIDTNAKAFADLTVENEKLNDAYSFSKSTTSGFFQTLKDDLASGANAWQAFGNAAMSVLNSITNKILDLGVDMLFQGLKASGMFTSNVTAVPTNTADPGVLSAKGNVFSNGLTAFAKGGTFTNKLYDKPTPFAFAGGGSFGIMGEAGPEAVMPLHRGSDGSLGVRVNGSGESSSGGNMTVNIVNNAGANVSANQVETADGMTLEVMVDKMTAQNMATPGSYSNQSLKSMSGQQMIRR